jgi:diguanylate cyclase (GGDEF)-like protein
MINQIQNLNLQRFVPFLSTVANCGCSIAIFDHAGNFCPNNYIPASAKVDDLSLCLDAPGFDWASLFADIHFLEISTSKSLVLNRMRLGANQQEFWLAVILDLPIAQLKSPNIEQLKLVIQQIAFCISEDYINAITMSGMAEELAVRYEELNLLYGLDESQDYLTSKNEYDALTQLISNCTDYLDVNLIALFILEQNVVIHQLINPNSNTNVPLILSELQGPLLHWMKANNETLVINRDADTDWTDANINIPYKIISTPLLKESGNLAGILILVNDMEAKDFTNSDRKLSEVLAIEAAMLIRARHDSLTELLNRKGFYEKLESAFEQVQAQGKMYSLIFLDVDQFKIVNDTSGQKAGDKLLIQIGALVKKELGSSDVIARLGADEFAILLDGYSLSEASKKAEIIKQIINQFRFIYELRMYDIALSIGVVWIDPAAKNISELLSAADLACRMAKEKGGNRVHIYHPSDQELLIHENQMQWISRINQALIEQRFQLYKQRILPLGEADPYEHYELLIRLKDENGQMVSPIQFIPAAERYGLMTKLDRWVVKTALAKMAECYAADCNCNLACSINLSGQSFCEQGFLEYLIIQVNSSGLPPASICFEITETVAVSNLSQTIEFMQAVKKIGCKFSLDDFGSGMSSFTYLKNLPVDYLKIDGYFVKSILENKIDYAMVQAINQIGQVMGLKTIAEFVENDAILAELKKIGVDYGQGYGIGEPKPF